MKLSEIAKILGKPYFNGNVEIKDLKGIEDASTGDLVFITKEKFLKIAENNKVSALIIPETLTTKLPHIKSDNPQLDFLKILKIFYPDPFSNLKGISKNASISPKSSLGKNVYIGDFSIIFENVSIGNNVKIFPHVTIYPNVKIGKNCIIHSFAAIRENTEIGDNVIIQNGAVIGGDGFGFVKDKNGIYHKIPHIGKVIIEDNVEIQANSCVDRAPYGKTVIRKGTKIDNLVQIGHGCQIGKNCVFSAQTGIAGSSQIGNNVICAGQVGIADHSKIGDNAILLAKTGVTSRVKSGQMVNGYPPFDAKLFRKIHVSLKRLPTLLEDFKKLKKKVEKLERKNE